MGDLRDARVVVIGGAGFVGSHTVEQLLDEPVKEVVVVDNFIRGKRSNLEGVAGDPRLTIVDVPTDILRTDALDQAIEGADAVLHLASLWLTYGQAFPRSSLEVNAVGTFNVFEACLKQRIPKLVFASSASVYGDAVSVPMTEDHPYNNKTIYGATKICTEVMAKALHHSHGLPFIGLRYMNIYGPRQDSRGAYNSVVVKMLDAAQEGRPLSVHGDGTQSYDFISVRDIARANTCALRADNVHGFFNVCTGVATSINQLAETIRDLTHSSSPITHMRDTPSFVTKRVGCPSRAQAELGFEHSLDLRAGLLDFIDWRRDVGLGPQVIREAASAHVAG